MIEIIGWIGAILFCLCGAPQAYSSYKQGHSRGLSHAFIWMWFLGEVLTLVYVLAKHGLDLPLVLNYLLNLLFLGIIIKYKYKERVNYEASN